MNSKLLLSILLLLSITGTVYAQSSKEIKGIVMDNDGNSIPYAHILISNSSKGTFSNLEGAFSITISEKYAEQQLQISATGFEMVRVNISALSSKKKNKITLKSFVTELDEVVITPKDMREILREALRKIPENYALEPAKVHGFYRNRTLLNEQTSSYIEAAMDIYLQGIREDKKKNQLELVKARSVTDSTAWESFSFDDDSADMDMDMTGMAHEMLESDLVKDNGNLFGDDEEMTSRFVMFLNDKTMDYYSFEFVKMTTYQGRSAMVIDYKPRWKMDLGMFEGRIILDEDTKAFCHVDYNVPKSFLKYIVPIRGIGKGLMIGALKFFGGLTFNFHINHIRGSESYQFVDNKWYPKYKNGDFSFFLKVKYPREKINIVADIGIKADFFITDVNTEEIDEIAEENRLKKEDSLVELSDAFDDPFWSSYPLIPASEDVLKDVEQLN
ncbi:carboxypeptidase-like regulatory domain-containing protein [Flammeovirga sp. SJP92]|uniref:carboxypeptidase-like regulatory domain-containing protein n=1 Tax=Flammeovirga sp. SJP92 TaxID=1775430 RepID=UPI0009EE3C3E|nr:carboxypeptidase-like regulatory domain-containing protein [Flammeovirga sp. SJP92]